ncbi:MAG: DNA/RNA nuclease SfsA [Alphaproteobacteria bacterium]|jgi:sugar fermentation stimulation protein A|nr:DNA/RNA nuclease SfsA [Alphaproteobacteria bacterium]
MQQPILLKATLIKRYKRFLADVRLENGEIHTAHCANSGSMLGLVHEGNTVYLSHAKAENKLKYKLEMIDDGSSLVGVNTHLANKIAAEGFSNKLIKPLEDYNNIRAEVSHGASRIDFCLDNTCFVEVKSTTLKRQQGIAEFPDSPTARGAKHLNELINIVQEGKRAINLYIVQRTDCTRFKIAKDIDSLYYKNFMLARSAGVEFLCYDCDINLNTITINKPIEIIYD